MMDSGVRALIDAREAREAAETALQTRKAAKARRRHLVRVFIALVLILAAYWIGYERGLASALFH